MVLDNTALNRIATDRLPPAPLTSSTLSPPEPWAALAAPEAAGPAVPPPAMGPGTLIPSAQRLVWAAKQPLGNAALGALFA